MRDARDLRITVLLLAAWVVVVHLDALSGARTWLFHDLLHHHYPWRDWVARTWAEGQVPLWAPVAHGYPLLADGQAGVLYPPDRLLYLVLPVHVAFSWSIVLHQLLALLGGIFLARELGRSAPASTFAGLAYGLSGFLVSHLVYLPMFQVMAWIPWLVAATVGGVRRGGRAWLGAAMVTGFIWLAGHPQLALYGCWAALAVGAWHAVEERGERGVRPFVGLFAMFAAGALLALPQLLATAELVALGSRSDGLDPASAGLGALPPEELLHAAFPQLLGFEGPADVSVSYHHRAGAYAGRGVSFWEDTFYLGIPAILMAIAAGRARRARVWWALLLFGVLVMLGPQTPFWGLYRLLPGAEWFRFPVRGAIFVTLAVGQLAAIGIDRMSGFVIALPERVAARVRRLALVVVVGLLGAAVANAALTSGGDALVDALGAALERPAEEARAGVPAREARDAEAARERAAGIVDELVRSTDPLSPRVFWPAALAASVALLWGLTAGRRLHPQAPARLLWGVLALDLVVFARDLVPRDPVDEVLDRPASAVPALGLPGSWRATVLDRRVDARLERPLVASNLGLLWGLEDVIVPSPLRTIRNEAYLAEVGLDLGIVEGEEQVRRFREARHLADLSGVRFLFTLHDLDLPDLVPVYAAAVAGAGEAAHVVRVYENRRALPRAFVVGCTRSVPDADAALEAVVALRDPAAVAVVEGEGLEHCAPGPVGTVSLLEAAPGLLRMEAELEREGWLVVTESAYPGQELRVDGEPVPLVRTDHLFQGARLPAGRHAVVFAYRPRAIHAALGVSGLAWGLALAGLVFWRPGASSG